MDRRKFIAYAAAIPTLSAPPAFAQAAPLTPPTTLTLDEALAELKRNPAINSATTLGDLQKASKAGSNVGWYVAVWDHCCLIGGKQAFEGMKLNPSNIGDTINPNMTIAEALQALKGQNITSNGALVIQNGDLQLLSK